MQAYSLRTESRTSPEKCGRSFTVDPAWGYVPTFCKECRQQLSKEKETKQRQGAPHDVKRRCKACGQFFSFPSDTASYPSYCPNCRKRHQAEMKEKYSRKKQNGGRE